MARDKVAYADRPDRTVNFRGFDFAFIVCDDGSDRYAVASQIARALPIDIPWLAPDIAVALHRPAVREAISCWLERRKDTLA